MAKFSGATAVTVDADTSQNVRPRCVRWNAVLYALLDRCTTNADAPLLREHEDETLRLVCWQRVAQEQQHDDPTARTQARADHGGERRSCEARTEARWANNGSKGAHQRTYSEAIMQALLQLLNSATRAYNGQVQRPIAGY